MSTSPFSMVGLGVSGSGDLAGDDLDGSGDLGVNNYIPIKKDSSVNGKGLSSNAQSCDPTGGLSNQGMYSCVRCVRWTINHMRFQAATSERKLGWSERKVDLARSKAPGGPLPPIAHS